MSAPSHWQLLAFLPNLSLHPDGAFTTDYLCICSTKDERLESLTATAADRTAAVMARSFETWFGVRYAPSCLLVRHDAPQVCRRADVLRAFRNVCAHQRCSMGQAMGQFERAGPRTGDALLCAAM